MMSTYQVGDRILNSVELKAELYIEGVEVDRSALEGVGTKYKEQIHGGFDFDETFHVHEAMPAEITLPDGTLLLPFRKANTPYRIRKANGSLVLERQGQPITEITYVPRPRFYNRVTQDGVPMSKIAQAISTDCVVVCYSNYCDYFRTNDQCRFCNLNPTREAYKGEVLGIKQADQVGEAVAAAFQGGEARAFVLTGGVLPQRKELDGFQRVIESIQKFTSLQGLRTEATIAAPTDLKEIDRVREAGYSGVNMNLEIWDRNIFAGICPGKAKTVGWERWVEALKYGAEVFGRGNVRSVFVTGIEPQEAFLEGADYLASVGVFAFASPWYPDPGSKMEGHRTPTPAWHLDLSRKLVEIWQRHGYAFEELAKFAFAPNFLFYDEWKRRQQEGS